MPAIFDRDGIRFQYPENWKLETEERGDGWAVSVQSPHTAFFLLSLQDDFPEPAELLSAALDALKADYPDLEAEECVDTVAGQPAEGQDICFISLDLPNSCWTRALVGPTGTLFVLCQLNDLECETNEPVLRAICASLEMDD